MSSDLRIVGDVLNNRVVESPEMMGKECITCNRILEYKFFKKDASCRDGRRDLCDICASAPRMSTEEHFLRLRESNNGSDAVKKQRWEHQDEYRDDAARLGRGMYTSDFLRILKTVIPSLCFVDGRVDGDVAVYRTYDRPQDHLGGRDFEYLFYIPTKSYIPQIPHGWIPEYSLYEFDTVRDIPLREKHRGWRTPLLMLIERRLLTEQRCDEIFGRASGVASNVWYRKVRAVRN